MILIWGLSWPINKIGLSYTSPTNFIELRFFLGTIAIFLIALFSKNLVLPRRKDLPIILTMGIFQMALLLILATYGLSIVPAGKATFLTYSTSIWIIPLAALLDRKIGALEILSFCIGASGVVLMIEPWKSPSTLLGDFALFLAAISWSIGILCARHLKWHRPLLQLLPWQLLVATVITIVFAYSIGVDFLPNTLDITFIGTLVYTGIIAIAIGYWIMILVSSKLSPSMTSLGILFVPIISLIISCIFLDEKITLNLILSITLIITGVLIHIYSEKNKHQKHNEIT